MLPIADPPSLSLSLSPTPLRLPPLVSAFGPPLCSCSAAGASDQQRGPEHQHEADGGRSAGLKPEQDTNVSPEHTHTHALTHAPPHTSAPTPTQTHTNTHKHTPTHAHTRPHTHPHTPTHTLTLPHTHTLTLPHPPVHRLPLPSPRPSIASLCLPSLRVAASFCAVVGPGNFGSGFNVGIKIAAFLLLFIWPLRALLIRSSMAGHAMPVQCLWGWLCRIDQVRGRKADQDAAGYDAEVNHSSAKITMFVLSKRNGVC